MSTPNKYPGFCCTCGADVAEQAGIIRRYSGANKRSAPAGSRSRRTHGYNGMNSDSGPGAMGKYALWCIPCDAADQQSKRDERKLTTLNEKIYLAWNKELYRLAGLYDAACQACCAARDSGNAEAWQAASDAQKLAYAAKHDWGATKPVFLTTLPTKVSS